MDQKALSTALQQMLEIREMEEQILALSREGQVSGSVHLCFGQEAIPVGVRAAMHPTDTAMATYRGHGWAVAWGAPIEGILAEVSHKQDGINGGRAGSLLLTHPQTGFLGQNSIVGAGTVISNGVALAYKLRGENNVTVVSIGDGAMNQGAVHEAFAFAAAFDLPVIFCCENNGWSEMTPITDMVRGVDLVDRVQGYGILTRVVDGQDVAAVTEATRWAREKCLAGEGPVFLEFKTYRLRGHYNRDIEHYRPKADIELAKENDPIDRLGRELNRRGVMTEDELKSLKSNTSARIADLADRVRDMPAAAPAMTPHHGIIADDSQARQSTDDSSTPALETTYQKALNLAMRRELETRPEAIIFGEDVGKPGGVHGVTRSLHREFGEFRVFDTPISESAILGAAIGSSMVGMRPIVEIMWADFLFVAFDQIINQAPNMDFLSHGELSAPLTIRTQQGITPGSCAQHSQSIEGLLAHIPGLKVGLATTPHDAYHMLRAAVADDGPVVLIEDRSLYQQVGPVRNVDDLQAVGGAVKRRDGKALTIVTWGQATKTVLTAADALRQQGIEPLVLDLRWLRPLDEAALVDAVQTTSGRVLIVHDAPLFSGFGAEIAAKLHEMLPDRDLMVRRLGGSDARIPAAPSLQEVAVPTVGEVVHAAAGLARMENRREAEGQLA